MKTNNENSYVAIKERMNNLVEGITKCYILLNYAYNTEEKTKLYQEEFKKRYISFYKEIIETESIINYNHFSDIGIEIKKMLNLDFYKSKMSFLDQLEIDDEGVEPDTRIETEYNVKTTIRTVKLNFYHNNKYEFGNNTRNHVNPIEYGIIDPKPRDDMEEECIFSSLTSYFINNYMSKNNKILTMKNM